LLPSCRPCYGVGRDRRELRPREISNLYLAIAHDFFVAPGGHLGIHCHSDLKWVESRVSRWRALAREKGEPRPGPLGGDRRSGRIEAQGGLIRSLLEEAPAITVQELCTALAARGHAFGYGTLQRFFRPHGITRKKKTAHASEQDRPDVLRKRRDWFEGPIDLHPD